MTRKTFSAESATCRADALITCPSWHNQMSRAALRDLKLTATTKGLLYVLDYVGHGPVATIGYAELAAKLGITQRQLRTATTSVTGSGYLRREQFGGFGWRWWSLNRSPYAWTPGWTMRWFELCPELTLRHLVLYLVLIDLAMQDEPSGTKGLWCERSLPELARLTGVRKNEVSALLNDLVTAGLVLKVGGPGRIPILQPCVEPEDQAARDERAECLLRIMQDRDDTTQRLEIQGVDSVFPVDNDELAQHITFKADGELRPAASWAATGRSRRMLATTGGTI